MKRQVFPVTRLIIKSNSIGNFLVPTVSGPACSSLTQLPNSWLSSAPDSYSFGNLAHVHTHTHNQYLHLRIGKNRTTIPEIEFTNTMLETIYEVLC